MSKYQRDKGKRGEQQVVDFWKELFPKAHRHLEFQKIEANKGVDVILNEGMAVQVKTGKQVPIKNYKFIEQIQEEDKITFVQMKRDRKEWLILMKANVFKKMLDKLK